MPRQSNIELLRIISMVAVIVVHLDGASVGLPVPGSLAAADAADLWRIAVESLTIVGVNCFTLISGYFGIRARMRGLVIFTLTCVFYSVGLYTFSAMMTHSITPSGWFESWLVFTHTDLWYVPAYLILYLLSPMLNSAVSSLRLKQFTLWLGLFTAANIWCGWMWHANFNPTGYTPVQLIMMYLIGRWIATVLPAINRKTGIRNVRRGAVAVYFASTFLTAFMALRMQPATVYAYNAPWVIVSSVALFVTFAQLRVTSRSINRLAKGAFAAYLIHKNPAMWGGLIRPLAIRVWQTDSLWIYSGFTVAFTAAIYLTSVIADSFRAWLFGKCESLVNNKVKVKT